MKTEMTIHPDQEYKYGGKPTWSKIVNGLQIEFWRERWSDLEAEEDLVRHRLHHFKISAGNRLVADGTFDEWNARRLGLNYFACVADSISSDTYEMGEALFSSFCRDESKFGESPLQYGSILVFDRVRIQAANAHESKQVWLTINHIIGRLTRNRRNPIAGLILKAFPLDNMGMNSLLKGDEAFDRRQRAMMRLYEQRLGVETLPGEPGEDGWQWLGIDYPASPKLSKRRPKYI